MATGIIKRGNRYQAWVWSARDGKKIKRTFATRGEAKAWRVDAQAALNQGTLRASTPTTLREAAEAWLAGAEDGSIRSRSGQPFKPATLRGYRQALTDHVLPVMGGRKLSAVTTTDLQSLVDRWQADGMAASTIRNAIKPLQAIYRRAKSRGGLPVNPTTDLELPAPRPKEVEIVAPEVGAALLGVLPTAHRPLWATALYAGLRYGELRALRWGAVDLASGTIRVAESWDPKAGPIDPKTRTSTRTVPMPGVLRDLLTDHRLNHAEADGDALVFGRTESEPFHAASLYRRADAAWAKAGIEGRLRLHQCRHAYASFMIAAGVNAHALMKYMGHSSIKVTFDLYGHLMPGNEAEAAGLLDAYLERADSDARKAAVA